MPNVPLSRIKWQLFLLGLFKIPMIGFVRPKLVDLSEEEVIVRIKLNRRSKNHLNSMYLGALVVGADIAAGIHAFYFSSVLNRKVSFAFKGMYADFIQRSETDVIFMCKQGLLIKDSIEKSIQSGERINREIEVLAFNINNECVAKFQMNISVKVK